MKNFYAYWTSWNGCLSIKRTAILSLLINTRTSSMNPAASCMDFIRKQSTSFPSRDYFAIQRTIRTKHNGVLALFAINVTKFFNEHYSNQWIGRNGLSAESLQFVNLYLLNFLCDDLWRDLPMETSNNKCQFTLKFHAVPYQVTTTINVAELRYRLYKVVVIMNTFGISWLYLVVRRWCRHWRWNNNYRNEYVFTYTYIFRKYRSFK